MKSHTQSSTPVQQLQPSSNEPGSFELWSLPVGGRFTTSPNPYDRSTITGTVLSVMRGCVRVRLNRQSKKVAIHPGSHSSKPDVEFDSSRSRDVYWDRETPVKFSNEVVPNFSEDEYQDQDDEYQSQSSDNGDDTTMANNKVATKSTKKKSATPARATKKKSATPAAVKSVVVEPTDAQNDRALAAVDATPVDPKIRAINARWKMAVTQLGQLLKIDGPSTMAQTQRDRIQSIYDEAVAMQVKLPDYGLFVDPVFAEMELGPADVLGALAEGHAAPPKPRPAAATASSTKAGPTFEKKGTPEKGRARAKKPNGNGAAKALKVLHPCLEGCGTMVPGNFKQGHDARYRSLVLKVERGEMKTTELPVVMAKTGGRDGGPLQFKPVKDGLKCVNSVLNH